MIQFSHVHFGYGAQKLFTDLSTSLEAGHIYGLLGENGVGKTTLLKMIAGLVFPKGGTVTTLSHEPRKRQPSLMQQLYFVAEDAFVPDTTARRLADTYGVFYPMFDGTQYFNYLQQFGVNPHQKLEKVSFGQRKKALISFALATNVPLLLMDEPTNGLDIPSKSTFRKLVAGAATDERCIIISTHQVRDLESLIDTVVVLHNGKITYREDLNVLAEESTSQPDLETLFQDIIQK
ncbi:ABC transporter ATP-binding protein [Runella slithyformis]|uniref:ABC transporter related protein n=1 Tax=Runella slithyformis (strain ATCC 29530 / DSM 19594 / LMG 11500 / NCIMB 11436 / LSU 4) TaxID=761193 RepID=A0A7U4E496_RUNSL|nr:ABC transporter ATP-binding protein [Runella slithyformis]AEI47064.1 ABC transporter related protein [Runella slithyformis DSM 19594]